MGAVGWPGQGTTVTSHNLRWKNATPHSFREFKGIENVTDININVHAFIFFYNPFRKNSKLSVLSFKQF